MHSGEAALVVVLLGALHLPEAALTAALLSRVVPVAPQFHALLLRVAPVDALL